eukprot:scaffold141974_cov46-Attheya_sp.AAC.2
MTNYSRSKRRPQEATLAALQSAKKLHHLSKALALAREAVLSDGPGDVTSNDSEQTNVNDSEINATVSDEAIVEAEETAPVLIIRIHTLLFRKLHLPVAWQSPVAVTGMEALDWTTVVFNISSL